MEYGDSKNGAIKIRTKRLTNISWVIIVVVFLVTQLNAVHIDFDDADTSWLENVTVHMLPDSQKLTKLKVTGLKTAEIEDGIRIQPTFSDKYCSGNETDLSIINDALSINSINHTTNLIVSLDNFDFKRNKAAYLCIKTKFDHIFQHMGPKSKFSK